MKITKANGKSEYALIENLKKRSGETDQKIVDIVSSIIEGVKEGGDEAVRLSLIHISEPTRRS